MPPLSFPDAQIFRRIKLTKWSFLLHNRLDFFLAFLRPLSERQVKNLENSEELSTRKIERHPDSLADSMSFFSINRGNLFAIEQYPGCRPPVAVSPQKSVGACFCRCPRGPKGPDFTHRICRSNLSKIHLLGEMERETS